MGMAIYVVSHMVIPQSARSLQAFNIGSMGFGTTRQDNGTMFATRTIALHKEGDFPIHYLIGQSIVNHQTSR